MIMKYFAAMCLLAAPVAFMSVAPTSAEAGYHGKRHVQCHWVKKKTWRHGKKRVRFVKVCGHRNHH
jgi:hypothetical protein